MYFFFIRMLLNVIIVFFFSLVDVTIDFCLFPQGLVRNSSKEMSRCELLGVIVCIFMGIMTYNK